MKEPVVTIALCEYQSLLSKANSRDAGYIEVRNWDGRTYFLPPAMADAAFEKMGADANDIIASLKKEVKRLYAYEEYVKLPWLLRLITKKP